MYSTVIIIVLSKEEDTALVAGMVVAVGMEGFMVLLQVGPLYAVSPGLRLRLATLIYNYRATAVEALPHQPTMDLLLELILSS